MTEKIYESDRYMKEADVKITDIIDKALVFDKTIFAPEAGGQVCDLGTVNYVDLTSIIESKGEILHYVKDASGFKIGDLVKLRLDWHRRFDHMQNHCGEHIVSGIIKQEYGVDNKGFHLGDDVVTLDIDMKEISGEMLTRIENLANEAVYSNIPVTISMIENREEAEKLPLRKPLKVDEDISVVSIEGVDCVACCCPHPMSTAEVGLIKIVRTEKYKGMTRVYIKCGMRAFEDFRVKHDIVTQLNKKYSAEDSTLLEKIKTQETKNNIMRSQLNAMKQKFAQIESEELVSYAADNNKNMIEKEFESGSVEDMMTIAKKVMEVSDLPIVLSSVEAKSVLITHSGKSRLKCGQIVKEFAIGAGGKGGGNDTQARAIFNDIGLMQNFVEIVRAHTR